MKKYSALIAVLGFFGVSASVSDEGELQFDGDDIQGALDKAKEQAEANKDLTAANNAAHDALKAAGLELEEGQGIADGISQLADKAKENSEASQQLTDLSTAIDAACTELNIETEEGASANDKVAKLQEAAAATPGSAHTTTAQEDPDEQAGEGKVDADAAHNQMAAKAGF